MPTQAPVAHPLGPPSLVDNTISVDLMLRQPSRVTRMIADLTLQKFISDAVFASAGGVTGGAVVYDQATTNELYLDRDVERVSPGAEFPIVTSERLAPKVAEVEKWGGKIFITDEARDRNDSAGFTNEVRKLSNTIVRKLNQRTIAELEASIAATGQSGSGQDWSDVTTAGTSASSAQEYPAADFANQQLEADKDELGVVYDQWILNPQEMANLAIIYGNSLNEVLASFNLKRPIVSNRVTAGTAYVVATQQVGEQKIEKPLSTETWREEKTERTWVQASVRPVCYVTNPYAVRKVTGLAG